MIGIIELGMLFLLMGALAVPMLWRSPRFTRSGKIVLSIVAVLQTIVVLIILAMVLVWFLGQVSFLFAS